MKYYVYYNNNTKQMTIAELNETALKNRSKLEKMENSYNSLPIYDSITECIKSLGSYSKPTLLPNREIISPYAENYPNEQNIILKKVLFPMF